MSIEKLIEAQTDSEIIKDPKILVKKAEDLLKKPQDEQNKEEFKVWISKEWREINKALLQLPNDG
jgi:hypothetical protein